MPHLFALEVTASDAAGPTGRRVRSVNAVHQLLRRRLPHCYPVPADLGGAPEL